MSHPVMQRLARFLSVTEVRSGEAIAAELGCSRTAVWKHVKALRELGIEVDAVVGQGYRLAQPLELLDRALICAALEPGVSEGLSSLAIHATVDSTNSALQNLPLEQQHAAVVLAEHQSSGRGRRGRQWHSPFGRNLYLSLGWRFEQSLSELGCLPLVTVLAAAQALKTAGLKGHVVKWPNDLLLDGQKLAGCLVEVQGDAQGPCHAVLGVGINVHMPVEDGANDIDQPWTDMQSQLPAFSRNTLAALLLNALFSHLARFAGQGFTPFREQWIQLDGLKGRTISVYAGDGEIRGVASGINERGALKLNTGSEMLSLHSGEVSLNQTKI